MCIYFGGNFIHDDAQSAGHSPTKQTSSAYIAMRGLLYWWEMAEIKFNNERRATNGKRNKAQKISRNADDAAIALATMPSARTTGNIEMTFSFMHR